MFKLEISCLAVGILLGGPVMVRAAGNPQPPPPAPQAAMGEYNLADFGPVKTPLEAQATMDSAITNIIARGGGILVVGPGANLGVIENNAPSSIRGKPTVTIVDRRNGYESVLVPDNGKSADGAVWAGRRIARTIRQPIDGAFGAHSTENIDTAIAGGTTSYDQPSLNAVKSGKSRRIYVPTIRGLAPGLFIAISGMPQGYGEPYDRTVIKKLGWDKKTQQSYLVVDLKHAHPKGALVYDKHVVNSLTITDHSQSDNQSMALMVARQNYGIGDSFVIHAGALSQGNIMSGLGDEGGLCYGADIWNDLSPFRGTVESVNWKKAELVYEPGDTRNHTLGTSRAIVNLNTNKWLRQGNVYIVYHMGSFEPGKPLSGGGIIGSKDCGWTPDIVGRFLAFDEPSEYLDPTNDPGCGYTAAPDMRTYRWWQIHKFEENPDGTKRIWLERVSWYVQYFTPGMLYDHGWCSGIARDGKLTLKPMRYIIAPGAYVAGVSRAWTPGSRVDADSPRTLKLAPSPDAGGKFDFEKGDPIAQTIGPDPWNPTGIRVRQFNYLPSLLPDSSFQAANLGRVAVDSALGIGGGSPNLDEDAKTMKGGLSGRCRFKTAVGIGATTRVGIRFGADVSEAAILFEQPHNRVQPIWWRGSNLLAVMSVDPKTGYFGISGFTQMNGIRIADRGGISGSAIPARNLRGIALPVAEGAAELKVSFERPEADTQFALVIQPSWATATAVMAKAADAFTVQFKNPAPAGATIDWFLVR